MDSGLWKSTVKLIENGDWSLCAKTSRVYILPRDKDPRLRDELKIRVGDLENFAHSLFYLTPLSYRAPCSPFFHPLYIPKTHTIWNMSVWHSTFSCASLSFARRCFLQEYIIVIQSSKRLSVFQFYWFRCKSYVCKFIEIFIIMLRDKAVENKYVRLHFRGS